MLTPPWEFRNYSDALQGTARQHFGTMPLDWIKALPVAPLTTKDCALLLWATGPLLPEAFEVISAWGFTYKTVAFNWIKTNPNGEGLRVGNWYWTLAGSEICLLATKGSPTRIAKDVRQVFQAPVTRHSEKPEEARRRIERLLCGPYLELFARRKVEGWYTWGDEIAVEEDPPVTRRRRGRPPKIKTQLEAAE